MMESFMCILCLSSSFFLIYLIYYIGNGQELPAILHGYDDAASLLVSIDIFFYYQTLNCIQLCMLFIGFIFMIFNAVLVRDSYFVNRYNALISLYTKLESI